MVDLGLDQRTCARGDMENIPVELHEWVPAWTTILLLILVLSLCARAAHVMPPILNFRNPNSSSLENCTAVCKKDVNTMLTHVNTIDISWARTNLRALAVRINLDGAFGLHSNVFTDYPCSGTF